MSTTTNYFSTPRSNASNSLESTLEYNFFDTAKYAARAVGETDMSNAKVYVTRDLRALSTTYANITPTFLSLVGKLAVNYRVDLGEIDSNWTDVSNSEIASFYDAATIMKGLSQTYINANKTTIVADLLAMQDVGFVNGSVRSLPLFANVDAIDAASASGSLFPQSSVWGSNGISTMVADASGAIALQQSTLTSTDPSNSLVRRTQAFPRYNTALGLNPSSIANINLVYPFTSTVIAVGQAPTYTPTYAANQPVFDFNFLINAGVSIETMKLGYTLTNLTLARIINSTVRYTVSSLGYSSLVPDSYVPDFNLAKQLGYTSGAVLEYLANNALYTSTILKDFNTVFNVQWTKLTDTFPVDASGNLRNRLSIVKPETFANIEQTLLSSDDVYTVALAIRDISSTDVNTAKNTVRDLSASNPYPLRLHVFGVISKLVDDFGSLTDKKNAFGASFTYDKFDPTIFAPLFKYDSTTQSITATTNAGLYTVENFITGSYLNATNKYALIFAIVGSANMLAYRLKSLSAGNASDANANFLSMLENSVNSDYTIASVFDASAGTWSYNLPTSQLMLNVVSGITNSNFNDNTFKYIAPFIAWTDISSNAAKVQYVNDLSANFLTNNTALARLLDYGVPSYKIWNLMGSTDEKRALHLLPSGNGFAVTDGMLAKVPGSTIDLLNVYELMRKLPMTSYSAIAGAKRMSTSNSRTVLDNWVLAFADVPVANAPAIYANLPLCGFTFGECLTYTKTMTKFIGGVSQTGEIKSLAFDTATLISAFGITVEDARTIAATQNIILA